MNNLESAPADFRYPNNGTRDLRDSDEKSGDESVVDSEDEDSDIDLDFTHGSEDEEEWLCLKLSVLIFSFHLQSCEIYFISIEVKKSYKTKSYKIRKSYKKY